MAERGLLLEDTGRKMTGIEGVDKYLEMAAVV